MKSRLLLIAFLIPFSLLGQSRCVGNCSNGVGTYTWSGILFEKSAVEAGCNVGAQGIIFTEYGCLTGQEVIQLKLVDCQTSELYWSATGINATAKQVLDKVREELEKE
jgi:hypothetical protein